jgi:hypothetical protein
LSPMVDGGVQSGYLRLYAEAMYYSRPMGLDAVEIVLRVEELFGIEISDEEAASVRTVGDLYELICARLNVVPLASPVTSKELPTITQREKVFFFLARHTPLPAPPEVLPWSPQSAWDCLVALLVDQQGLKPRQIKYEATLVDDFGID